MSAGKLSQADQAARLNANHPLLNLVIDRVRQYVASDKTFFGSKGKTQAPRFGVFSLLLRRTPVYVYDHPAIEKLCDTAFTNGTYIFLNASFLEKLLQEEKEAIKNRQSESNVIPILLHELAHILFHHVQDNKFQRLRQIPDAIANIASDIEINQRLVEDFQKEIRFGEYFRNTAYGLMEDELLTFKGKSAETIAKLMMNAQTSQQSQSLPSDKSDKSDKSKRDGQDDHEQAHKGKGKGEDDTHGMPKTKKGKGMRTTDQILSDLLQDAENGRVETHTISTEKLEKTLRENGLSHVIDALKLPSNEKDRAKQTHKRQLEILNDLNQASLARTQVERIGAKMAGGHCESYASEIVENLLRPKLKWTAHIKDVIIGDGGHNALLEEEPHDIYYVDPDDMNMPMEIYLPSHVPAQPDDIVLCVVDTSGSVSHDELRQYFSEIFGLWNHYSDLVGEVVVLSADTVVRGRPLRITPDNWRDVLQKIKVFGRGGTNLETALRQAIQHVRNQVQDRPIRHVLYFTDLLDRPPRRENLPVDLPPITFLTSTPDNATSATSAFASAFERAVAGFAKVIRIEPDVTVDLSDTFTVNTEKTDAKAQSHSPGRKTGPRIG